MRSHASARRSLQVAKSWLRSRRHRLASAMASTKAAARTTSAFLRVGAGRVRLREHGKRASGTARRFVRTRSRCELDAALLGGGAPLCAAVCEATWVEWILWRPCCAGQRNNSVRDCPLGVKEVHRRDGTREEGDQTKTDARRREEEGGVRRRDVELLISSRAPVRIVKLGPPAPSDARARLTALIATCGPVQACPAHSRTAALHPLPSSAFSSRYSSLTPLSLQNAVPAASVARINWVRVSHSLATSPPRPHFAVQQLGTCWRFGTSCLARSSGQAARTRHPQCLTGGGYLERQETASIFFLTFRAQ